MPNYEALRLAIKYADNLRSADPVLKASGLLGEDKPKSNSPFSGKTGETKYSEETIREMIKLHEKQGYPTIAAIYGTSPSYVRELIIKYQTGVIYGKNLRNVPPLETDTGSSATG